MKTIIITGVSRGLGKAFFDILKDKSCYLICISRCFIGHQSKQTGLNKNIELIKLDLNNTKNLILKLKRSTTLKKCDFDELVFINNAGVVFPIKKVGSIDEKDIIESININFVSPFLITNFLSDFCIKNQLRFKILNITTGAATKPFEGWSAYCSTKAATRMLFSVIEKEKSAVVESIDPGVINTDMQKEIRSTTESNFPLIDYFKNLEKKNKLQDPSRVAFNILKSSGLI